MKKVKHKKLIIALVASLTVLILVGTAAYNIMNSRDFQFFGGIVNHFDTKEKVVALTFDDGPTQKVADILPILDSENVKATFFLIGSEIKQHPEETKKLISSGQQIGNHTYSHNPLVFKSSSYVKNEIEETDKLIREMGYTEPIQFRPPNGKKLFVLPYYLMTHDRKTILWNIEPNSYPEINSSSDKIVQYVLDNVKPGSIILLHPMTDNKGTTIGSIKGIIQGLKDEGYAFKTINELFAYE